MIKKLIYTGLLLLAAPTTTMAQNVELKEIVQGEFTERGIAGIHPLADGEHYLQLDSKKSMILKYSYKSGEVVDTLFHTESARECDFDSFDGYEMSPDEKQILLYTDSESIYRRSFKANYYTFEIKRNLVKPLSQGGKQQAATIAPNGRFVAFVRDNNIFLKRLDFGTETPVTKDGCKDSIINGIPDWVYEEEFATSNSMSWSADSERLAFIKYDERDVPLYTMQMMEGSHPTYSEYTNYPGEFRYKYPVAGENNSRVSVHVYTVANKATRQMDVPLDADGYIPQIRFMPEEEELAVFTMNRHQNRLTLFKTNSKSGVSRLLLEEKNDTWIDPSAIDNVLFYPDFFTFTSGRSGYMHLYQYRNTGTLMRQVTQGDWDMTALLGYDEKSKCFFYEAAAEGAIYRAIYRIDPKGRTTQLSTQKGTNSAHFSTNCHYYINRYSSATTPTRISVHTQEGKELRMLQDNSELQARVANVEMAKKEFFTFTNEAGQELNAWILKPTHFDSSKKYPVVMLQYSGPGSQEVRDRWVFGWEQYLVANGFIVACADGRGTGGRGEEFAKCIYLQMGYLESRDQAAFAEYLGSQSFIDKENIAIWGWSFGGYTTLMAMSGEKPLFKAGIAIAPVTDWRYYDTVYTERYMRTPNENSDGYDKSSPLKRADQLKGNLLLISGTADDNVHPANSMQYNEALVQANILFDSQYYTNRNHSIFGGNTRLHLYTKVVHFLNTHLK